MEIVISLVKPLPRTTTYDRMQLLGPTPHDQVVQGRYSDEKRSG